MHSEFDIEHLRRCLERLPDEDKTVLFLHYFCGFSAAQIAEQLKISRGAVLLRLLRARRRLRKLLEG